MALCAQPTTQLPENASSACKGELPLILPHTRCSARQELHAEERDLIVSQALMLVLRGIWLHCAAELIMLSPLANSKPTSEPPRLVRHRSHETAFEHPELLQPQRRKAEHCWRVTLLLYTLLRR